MHPLITILALLTFWSSAGAAGVLAKPGNERLAGGRADLFFEAL
jgi:hypothetical protein